jgi:hypothetical protein
MSKRFLIIVIAMVVAIAAVGIATVAGAENNSVAINQKIAGSIFNGIEVTVNGVTQNRALLNLDAKGAPGAARLEVIGGAIPAAPPWDLCPDDTTFFALTFVDGGFVETFNDQSMLFYALDESPGADNALCIGAYPTTGIFDYIITGGTGRFEGATGNATVQVTSWPVSEGLSAEAGTLTGTVQLP